MATKPLNIYCTASDPIQARPRQYSIIFTSLWLSLCTSGKLGGGGGREGPEKAPGGAGLNSVCFSHSTCYLPSICRCNVLNLVRNELIFFLYFEKVVDGFSSSDGFREWKKSEEWFRIVEPNTALTNNEYSRTWQHIEWSSQYTAHSALLLGVHGRIKIDIVNYRKFWPQGNWFIGKRSKKSPPTLQYSTNMHCWSSLRWILFFNKPKR